MNNIIKHENDRQPATFGTVVDQIFQNNLDKFFDEDFWTPGYRGSLRKTGHVPVNIKENDKTYELEIVAPGLKKEDFHLKLEGDHLTVSFENNKEQKQEYKNEGWFRQEYRKQSFSRSFSLDNTIDAANIVARYEDGILHLLLPKKEHVQKMSGDIRIQ